ncbi:MAG: hypothetical protein KatS3mg052_0636 [Candidatus Roseilinea sp.]|nr:MAG: hypothetical protein KatS3mg052_0636 [Candidatus Roseilinea sp.]
MAAAALILLPHAKVTLTASSQRISAIVPVTLDTRADRVNLAARTIPATRIDVIVEGRMSTNATGKKSLPSAKARGQVTFTNVLATPFVVPRNTVVRTTATSAPVRFVTLADVEVPPGGRAEVEIEAIEAGPSGNGRRWPDQPGGGRAGAGRDRVQRRPNGRRRQRDFARRDRRRLSAAAPRLARCAAPTSR